MKEQILSKADVEVKGLKIMVIVFLFVYGAVFIGISVYIAGTFRAFLHADASHTFFWNEIRIILDRLLTGPIYLFISFCVFKLITLSSHGEPFSHQSPRYMRKIAYSVFILALIGAITYAIYELKQLGPDPIIRSGAKPIVIASGVIFQILYRNLGTVLLGLGFLVIAKVIEVGVRLQQDQRLTI